LKIVLILLVTLLQNKNLLYKIYPKKYKCPTYVMSKPKETAAQMTTTASIMFQNSLRYDPGCRITPKSRICQKIKHQQPI
jgi:hypothetical protein